MTTLVQQTQFLLGPGRQGSLFSTAGVTRLLLQGCRTVATQALAVQKREMLPLLAGQDTYTLAADYVTTSAFHYARWQVGLRLYDSAGTAWYLIINTAGEVGLTPVAPVALLGGGLAAFRGLRLLDAALGVWYLYPETWGELALSSVAPSLAICTDTVQLRDLVGTPHYLGATSTPEITTSLSGTATLSAAAPDPKALVYVKPTAFERLDPRDTGTVPLYYTVYPPKQLRVYPTPGEAFDVIHYYFGNGAVVTDMPPAFTQEALWQAAAVGTARLGHTAGAQAAGQMAAVGLARLGPLYLPQHETLDAYVMPAAPTPLVAGDTP